MKSSFFLVLIAFTALTSCSKGGGGNNNPGPNCTAVSGATASGSAASVAKGQPFTYSATSLSNVTYSWTLPGGGTSTTASTTINAVDFSNEGWYVVTVGNSCAQTKKDSVYLDVTIPQGTAPCTPTNNQISYSNPAHQTGTFNNISIGENPSIPGIYEMTAWGTGPGTSSLTLTFHPSYKNNNQPPNGVYTTGTYVNNLPHFGPTDFDKVFVTVITYTPGTILYKADVGGKVYFSRVGGKMVATICGIPMSGNMSGTPFTTNMTLAVTEP